MKKIYIETSVVSYCVADRSENIRVAGHQLSTLAMWRELNEYDVYISDIVVEEASVGNEEQIALRLNAIKEFKVLEIDEKVGKLAELLLQKKVVPEKCPEDAMHIAVATVNEIDFIVTWNFKHINNPFTKNKIRQVIEENGGCCPVLCSPEELIGENDE
jgi:predicted nucleic acid-binding protein